MAIALVQRSRSGDSASTSSIVSAAASLGLGNLNVVLLAWNQGVSVSSIADTALNTYSRVVASVRTKGGAPNNTELWYAYNTNSHASNQVTVTFSGTATYRCLVVQEFSGVLTASDPLDSGTSGASASAGPLVTDAALAVSASENVICAIAEADGDSHSGATYDVVGFNATGDANNYFGEGYHIVTASETAGWSCGGTGWLISAASFKGAGGGATGQPTMRRWGAVPGMFNPHQGRAVGGGRMWGRSRGSRVVVPQWIADDERQAA